MRKVNWYVDPDRRTVRPAAGSDDRRESELLFAAPTARDAAEMGARRALAAEALFVAINLDDTLPSARYAIVGGAIEAQASDTREAAEDIAHLARVLGSIPRGSVAYEVWIEAGCRALVLGRVPR